MPVDSDYSKALKLGEKAYHAAKAKGEYPYLPSLDSILEEYEIKSEIPLGIREIPLDQIAGTKTAGRQQAFAPDFMPLMKENSEFAMKWIHLLQYQMDEGVSDPIIVYEFMNKYYVLEGNKRVSVFKYLNAYSISASVTRLIPRRSEDTQVRIFYEFLEFYRLTGINSLWFTKPGSYQTLLKHCSKKPDESWSDAQRETFLSEYLRFQKQFEAMGGKKLKTTTPDAFLFYLSLYPLQDLNNKTTAQLAEELETIWAEFTVLDEAPGKALVMNPEELPETGLFTRFLSTTGSRQVKIAFIHDRPMEESGWVYSHELGRMHLEQIFGDKICCTSYFMQGESPGKEAASRDAVIESAIEDGNHILFTTSERFLEASLKEAIAHPQVRILNCCINRSYLALPTYYARMYEAKFLGGMLAGAMCRNDRIAYTADYPILGSLANINAFALGARMTNPRSQVFLYWRSEKEGPSLRDFLREHDITMVSDVDMIAPHSPDRRYGLYYLEPSEDPERDTVVNLAAPIWNWGRFYERIIRDILSGSWKQADTKNRKTMNYWWGFSGGIIDLITSGKLPSGIVSLLNLVRDDIYNNRFQPFTGPLKDQSGKLRLGAGQLLDVEQIITMNWLSESVVGNIPSAGRLIEDAKELMDLQGVSEPETEGKDDTELLHATASPVLSRIDPDSLSVSLPGEKTASMQKDKDDTEDKKGGAS